jgi:hypothetical protein
MPKSSNPIVVGDGVKPAQDGLGNNLSTQVTIVEGAYEASQISALNPFNTYLGDDAQSHFDDLAGAVQKRPPYVGESSVSFTAGALTSSISGIPDWGVLKQADAPIWERATSITFEGVTTNSEDFLLPSSETFFYNRETPLPLGIEGSDPRTDSVFNIIDPLLLGGGEGASFLCGRVGDESINVGDPNTQRDFPLTRATYAGASDGTASDGFTISGFLFPADRGTLALVHWNGDTATMLTPASSIEDIRERVIAAINLNGGNNPDDPSIFTIGADQSAFPSRLSGQYDLYELQTAKYRSDLSNGGDPIPSLSADNSLGSVRLLRDSNAAYFGEGIDVVDTTRGHLPVLFGAYEWDTGTSDWVETEANFLAYRLPMLEDYSASGIHTPRENRERFFRVVQPASTTTPFSTAGNYVTLGSDHYPSQVARYRHVVKYSEMAGVSGSEVGSIALIHFKTESAFEKLARDGIAPSPNDLWSVRLFNYNQGTTEANTISEGEAYTPTGAPTIGTPIDALSNPIIRPYVYVSDRSADSKLSADPDGKYVAVFEQYNTDLTGGVFLRENGYYTTISGVKYLLPRFYSAYREDSSRSLGYQNIDVPINFSEMGGLSPFASPFYTSTLGALFEREYKTPLNTISLNFSAFTGEDNLSVDWNNGSTYATISESLIQRVEVPIDYMTDGLDSGSTLNAVSMRVRPLGDTGLCAFSEGLWSSALIKDPLYHYDGLGISKVLISTPIEDSASAPATKILYHSARLLSLIENCATSVVNLYVNYLSVSRTKDCAFSIFRYDEEGFRVYQELTIEQPLVLQKCSGLNKEGTFPVVQFPDYPTYRPAQYSNYTSTIDINTPIATFESVDDGPYYIEVHPTSDSSSNADYLQVVKLPSIFTNGDSGFADYQAIYDLRVTQSKLYENPSNWYESYGTLGYLLGGFLTYENGYTNHNNIASFEHPYLPALVASDDYGKWIIEAPKSDGTELPSYGNFTEDELGIISVQGMSAPLGLTVVIPAWADNASTLDKRGLSTLFTARKDTQERFLDESYRIYPNFLGFDVAYLYRSPVPTGWDANTQDQLSDGGLPLGVSPIDFFVRDDSEVLSGINSFGSNHSASGYLRNGLHLNFIGANDLPLSEVRALPPMPDAVLSGAKYGQPRRGVLVTPGQTDYTSSDYIPNSTYDASWTNDDGATPALWFDQPDNTEPAVDSVYFVRAFDMAFSRSGTTEEVEGISTIKFRVVGLSFDEFSGVDRGVEIQFKIPGKTAWLDCAKSYGYGDITSAVRDGAGCLVSASDKLLVDEGVICCDLNLNLGQNLFLNSEGEATVLVRVIHHMTSAGRALDFGVSGDTKTPIRNRRGLIGLEALRNSNGENFDGDETHLVREISVSLVNLADTCALSDDGATGVIPTQYLGFSIVTRTTTPVQGEGFSVYRATGISDVSYPVVVEDPAFDSMTIYNYSEPMRRMVYPWDITVELPFLYGYFQSVEPGVYTIYAVTTVDENLDPELNIAFEVNDSPVLLASGSLTYTNLLSGDLGTSTYRIHELTIGADLSVSLNLDVDTGTRLTPGDLRTTTIYLQGRNATTYSDESTPEVTFSLYDLTAGADVVLGLGTDTKWTLGVGNTIAYFEADQAFENSADTKSLECSLRVGRSYKMTCTGSHIASLEIKMAVDTPTTKWSVGAYALPTTTVGGDYTQLMPSGGNGNTYEHYFYLRDDGYLVFEYRPDPI